MKRYAFFVLLYAGMAGAAIGQTTVTEVRIGDSNATAYQAGRELDLLLGKPGSGEWRTAVMNGSDEREWRTGVDATTFLRDAEFSLPYTRGYTATGFFLTPYAQHRVGTAARLTLGVQLAGVAGYDGLRAWQPLVRLEYEPLPHLRLVMGSLYGTLSHGLHEAMLDRERYLYDHQEEGVQLLADYRLGRHQRWRMDTWLHWEELLEPWQPTQERFTLGSSQELVLWQPTDPSGRWTVSVPFSFLGSHRGGQFSSLDTCIQSLFNESVGLRLNWTIGRRSAVAVEMPLFFYQDISPEKHTAYANGRGAWPQVNTDMGLRNWRLLAHVGYWQGLQFIAPRGSYLFQSVSWHRPDFAVPERQMLTARLAVENRYAGHLALGLDTQYYYDLREQGLDFAFGLYMRLEVN